MADSITETGIAAITIAISDVFNRILSVEDGTAKWFRDELDQVWVKFNTSANHHVFPASRVREVLYYKRET